MTNLPEPGDRARALGLLEAAEFMRDAHFRDGLTVQEITTALAHTVDRADAMVGSLARDGFGAVEIAEMLSADAPAVSSAVVAPPTDHTTDSVREQLLQALDFSACLHLGYTTPEELLAAYDASRTPTSDRATTLTEIERKMLEYALALAQDKIWSLDGFTDEDQAAVTSLRRLADETPDAASADQAAELASLAVNAGRALQDEKRHYEIACQENARLRAKVFEWQGSYLDEVKVRQERDAEIARLRADRAAVLRWAADRYDRSDRIVTQMFGHQVAAELRRLADETATTEVVPCVRPEPHPAHSHSGLRKGTAVHGRCPGVPAAGARQDGAPDDVVTELTEAEFHDAAGKALARLGLTYAELEDQARRRDFSSAQARSLWVTIGGAAPAGARQDEPRPSTPPCAHCAHPKSDHDGRADHRAKHSPLVAGEPWCHACNAQCDYATAERQDGAQQ